MKNIVDFPDAGVLRKEAAHWIARLDRDEALSAEERDVLRKWIHTSSAHRQALQEAAELWDSLNILTVSAPQLVEGITKKPAINEGADLRSRLRYSRWKRFAYAASIAVILVAGMLLFRPGSLSNSNGYYATAIGDQRTIELADGSVIELNTDTQMKVEFARNVRDVKLLRGEAYFTVAKVENMPFQVNAGVGQVVAVGTAFSVYLKDKSVDVTVTEGRVAIGSASPGAGAPQTKRESVIAEGPTAEEPVFVDAGQLAIIRNSPPDQHDEASKVIERHQLSDRELLQRTLWKDGVLAFSRAPLHEVIAEISRYTTLDIQFSNQVVAEMPVIARFPIGDTELMLDIFENNFGLAVQYMGPNRVLLSAKEETESEKN